MMRTSGVDTERAAGDVMISCGFASGTGWAAAGFGQQHASTTMNRK
jgi:hypothetical protein